MALNTETLFEAVDVYYSVHKWGCPRGFGELRRRAIYFREAGRNAKYLSGVRELGSKRLILGS